MEQGDNRLDEADNEMLPTVGRCKQYLSLSLSLSLSRTHKHTNITKEAVTSRSLNLQQFHTLQFHVCCTDGVWIVRILPYVGAYSRADRPIGMQEVER